MAASMRERQRRSRCAGRVPVMSDHPLPLAEHQHGEVAPRQNRRRHEGADGTAEHDDVEVLGAHGRCHRRRLEAEEGALASSTRTVGAPAGRGGRDHGERLAGGDPLRARAPGARARGGGCAPPACRGRRPSSTESTAAWAMTGPVSVPASTKWTVHPVTRAPYASACACGRRRPRNAGSSAGWDVDDAIGEGVEEDGREQPHEPGQHHHVDRRLAQRGHQGGVPNAAHAVGVGAVGDDLRVGTPGRRGRAQASPGSVGSLLAERPAPPARRASPRPRRRGWPPGWIRGRR